MIYKLTLSNKSEFEIDEQDYQNVLSSVGTGNLAKIKQAIINPSFIVSIIPLGEVKERKVDGYFDENRRVFVTTDDTFVTKSLKDKFIKPDDTKQLR